MKSSSHRKHRFESEVPTRLRPSTNSLLFSPEDSSEDSLYSSIEEILFGIYSWASSEREPWFSTPDVDQYSLQNCLVLSQAAYEADPKSFLEDASKCPSHDFKSILVSKHLACQFLLAEVNDDRAIYIAFRGTSNWDDILTDLDIKLETADNYPWFGSCHRGFLKRAELVPLIKLINSELVGEKELVFCGHSMGGGGCFFHRSSAHSGYRERAKSIIYSKHSKPDFRFAFVWKQTTGQLDYFPATVCYNAAFCLQL